MAQQYQPHAQDRLPIPADQQALKQQDDYIPGEATARAKQLDKAHLALERIITSSLGAPWKTAQPRVAEALLKVGAARRAWSEAVKRQRRANRFGGSQLWRGERS